MGKSIKKHIKLSVYQAAQILSELPDGASKDIIKSLLEAVKFNYSPKPRPVKSKKRRVGYAERSRDKLIKKATKPEIHFEKILKECNIVYEFQYIYYFGECFFIVDFYLPEYSMVIEIDGGYHNYPYQKDKDKERDAKINHKILRYSNVEVMTKSNLVRKQLLDELNSCPKINIHSNST